MCDDGVVGPMVRGEVLAGDDSWEWVEFLVDTGADRTVFSAATLAKLRLQPVSAHEGISGLGGGADSVIVETQIRLTRGSLDIDVLGRDITGLFTVIVDQPGDTICLLGQHHHYTIQHER